MEPKEKTGMTARDWLIAIVVILVLAFLLAPREYGREKARMTSCRSNMRQLILGMLEYESDYDGRFPTTPTQHWAGLIYPYERSTGVYKCPEDPTESSDGVYTCSYAMNQNLIGHGSHDQADPKVTVALTEFDGADPLNMTGPEATSPYTNGLTNNSAWGGVRMGTIAPKSAPRHDPYVMYAACDGHVTYLRPIRVSSGIDSTSSGAPQDAVHASGTKSLGDHLLTFSKR